MWPHEVEPWLYFWYRGILDAEYNLAIAYTNSTLRGHTNSSKKATYTVTHWFTTSIQPLFHPLPPHTSSPPPPSLPLPPPLLLPLPDIESFPHKTDRFLVLVFFLEIYEKISDFMVTNTQKKNFHHNFFPFPSIQIEIT